MIICKMSMNIILLIESKCCRASFLDKLPYDKFYLLVYGRTQWRQLLNKETCEWKLVKSWNLLVFTTRQGKYYKENLFNHTLKLVKHNFLQENLFNCTHKHFSRKLVRMKDKRGRSRSPTMISSSSCLDKLLTAVML